MELINGCIKKDRRAQQQLYGTYAPRFFGVCSRYIKDQRDAEDVLVTAFFKIFENIENYSGKGNFEGWMQRIVVNECLQFLRIKTNFHMVVDLEEADPEEPLRADQDMEVKEILAMVDKLPTGYGTVFNLYVIEGYKHREIADMLSISIHTSKSQLRFAKMRLKEMLDDHSRNQFVQDNAV